MGKTKVTEHINLSAVRKVADFSVRLLQNTSMPSKNTLISPSSLLAALTMAQRGARGLTAMEMETTIGWNIDGFDSLLSKMFSQKLDAEEQMWNTKIVRYANAVWLCDDGRVKFNDSFIDRCKNESHAEVVCGKFDAQMVDKINQWAAEKTYGAIPEIVQSLPKEQVMFLTSALAFRGQWDTVYKTTDVDVLPFTLASGTTQDTEFMRGEENQYLIDDEARGFIKKYSSGRYAFAALLPDKGVPLEEYISHLTGERLLAILENPIRHKVKTLLPKFEVEQTLDMKEPLMQMGMNTAFDPEQADFSGIGIPADQRYNLCIGDISQNNKIQVNEEGTKAYSVTGISTLCCYACAEPEPYRVYLDRPFLYMVIDQKTNLPLFMGTITNLKTED